MTVTEVGIETEVSEVREKASEPMAVTEVGMETEESEVQEEKA